MVIFDNELSPGAAAEYRGARRPQGPRSHAAHPRHLRAARAETREGKLQVELAQLEYLLPRLVGSSAALSRLGGGIGTRGPGETKLETDRRRIRQRIHQIRKARSRGAQAPRAAARAATQGGAADRRAGRLHQRRQDHALQPADAGVGATPSNALFVTLDPLVRRVKLPDSRDLLVSDTVGFIDRLPHALVAAFRATLEEVASRISSCTSSTPPAPSASAIRRRSSACSRKWARTRCRGSRSTTSATCSARRRRGGCRRPSRARCASRREPARAATTCSTRSRRGWPWTSACLARVRPDQGVRPEARRAALSLRARPAARRDRRR